MSKFAPHSSSNANPRATPSTICQKCLGRGHFTYNCKKAVRPYVSRPSRTQLLDDPKLREKDKARRKELIDDIPEEFKNKTGVADKVLEAREKARKVEKGEPSKKQKVKSSSSGSESESSDSDSESGSDSRSGSGSSSESEDSEDSRDRRRRRPARSRSKSNS